MKLIIHRGTNQIGGSCIELATNNTRIILDIGKQLPDINNIQTNLDIELPKVNGLYKDNPKGIDAVFISHDHGDHAGLLEYINPEIPIYIGERAARIINITSKFVTNKNDIKSERFLKSGKAIKIGDFTITPYLVDHSSCDAYAFSIISGGKCVVYTGDFRKHGRKSKTIDYLVSKIPRKVDALLIEGTMMSRVNEHVDNEYTIEKKAYEFMQSIDKPVFVLQSSTNIDRLVSMYKASMKSRRILVMDIFTANIVSQLGESIPNPINFRNIRVFYPYYLTKKMFKTLEGGKLMKKFSKYRASREELSTRKNYTMLIRSSMLSDLQHIKNLQGCGMIYSMWKGYLKDARMKKIMRYAKINNISINYLHTSGHATTETIKEIIDKLKPQIIIPIHTEYPNKFQDILPNINVLLFKNSEWIEI